MKNEEPCDLDIKKQSELKAKNINNKICYLLISFHSGICTLSDLAVQYYLKDNLKLEPGSMAQVYSITLIPWMIKPIFGLITDFFPICGYRRKVYILFCGFMDIFCWLFMAYFVKTLNQAIIVLFFVNVAVAFSTVLAEAIVVELSKNEEHDANNENLNNEENANNTENSNKKDFKAKDLISLFFIIKDIGVLASSYLQGLFVDLMSLKTIFLISAFTPIFIIIGGIIFIDSNFNEDQDSNSSKVYDTNNNMIDKNHNNTEKKNSTEIELNNVISCKKNSLDIVGQKQSEFFENKRIKEESLDYENNKILIVQKQNENKKVNDKQSNKHQKDNLSEHLIVERSLFEENKGKFNRKNMLCNLFSFIMTKEILIPLFFMILFNSPPSYDDPLFYFLTNELKFSGNIMGQISLASSITAILAVIMYKTWFKQVKFKVNIIIGSVLYFIFSYCAYILTSRINLKLGISDYILCLFSSSATSMMAEYLGLPLLSLACIKSPKNLEGSVYSFFMSSLNFGGIISYQIGSHLTTYFKITSDNFKGLPMLISLCNILGIMPMFIVFLFDEKYFEYSEMENNESVNGEHRNIEKGKNEERRENIKLINSQNNINEYNCIDENKNLINKSK